MSAAEREAYERQLAEKEAAAAAEVARKEAELRSVQQTAAAQVAEAETQLEELSQEVQQYRDLNERYRLVSEENRQLYNTVQDLRGNIRVFCRVRPRGRTGDGTACMVEVSAGGVGVRLFSS
jgi:chromosome segregation ATPase